MPEDPGPLLLDTHCWIWFGLGLKQNFSSGWALIETAGRAGALLVSAMSVWEAAMLETRGRVRPQMPCNEWIAGMLEIPGLTLAPITPEIAIDSTRLPGAFHRDPADRILVATARRMRATLVTRDERILEYGRLRHVRVHVA